VGGWEVNSVLWPVRWQPFWKNWSFGFVVLVQLCSC
jgi:hypothetical protein